MKILFAGGGTGGHVVPILAIVRETRKIYQKQDLEFYYLGPKDEFGSILLSQEGVKVKYILAGKIRRYLSVKAVPENILDILFKIPLGVLQSFFYIFLLSPDLIFSKGGFGSVPVAIAGKILLTPIFLHESDVVPGLANRFISKFASEIFASFPKTEYFSLKKMIIVGNPIRKELLNAPKETAKQFFKIKTAKPVILVLGGSQGAQRINDKILEILADLLESFELILQSGEKNFETIKAEAKVVAKEALLESFHLFPFLKEPELRQAFGASDLIVSRAGSGSIFEIAAANKPSVLIPLPESAQNHQVKNAYSYSQNGACQVIEESNFTSHFFLERLKYLFSHPSELKKMVEASQAFARPEAAKITANYLVEYLLR